MIRVIPQPAPEDFEEKVARPGRAFLQENGIGEHDEAPVDFRWKAIWTLAHPQLYNAYSGVCAYLGMRFYRNAMGTDHFLPNKTHPWLAYTWANYRLCYRAFNSSKGWSKPFCDPFEVENAWFDIDLWTGKVRLTKEAASLPQDLQIRLLNTLEKLNEPDYLEMRLDYLDGWLTNKVETEWIERWAPFLHQVILRQGLSRE